MAKRDAGFVSHGIHIDVPRVTEKTKLGDLTVGQFVGLLVQVSSQITPTRKMDPRAMAEAVEEVQKLVAAPKSASTIGELVHSVQRSIIDRVPNMPRTGADGGPSPHAAAAGAKKPTTRG